MTTMPRRRHFFTSEELMDEPFIETFQRKTLRGKLKG
jgi:hypothetical protein